MFLQVLSKHLSGEPKPLSDVCFLDERQCTNTGHYLLGAYEEMERAAEENKAEFSSRHSHSTQQAQHGWYSKLQLLFYVVFF